MKNYTITVNGTVYEVSVEESSSAAPAASAAPKASAPKKAAAAPKKAAGAQGSVKVEAPMPGKILKTPVNAGSSVKKGDVILVLEAMKMENEIVAPQDGTLVSVNVAVGQAVEAGEVLATLD